MLGFPFIGVETVFAFERLKVSPPIELGGGVLCLSSIVEDPPFVVTVPAEPELPAVAPPVYEA